MVGRLSRMRVSSVMRIFPPRISVGTLKSTRTRTRFPRTSRSRSISFAILLLVAPVLTLKACFHTLRKRLRARSRVALFPQQLQQLDATGTVAPFVIVPADGFHKPVAKHERQLAVKNTGVRITNDILGNEWLITVLHDAFVGFV